MRSRLLVMVVLVAACQGPNLATTDQMAVIVTPTSHDFGTLQVGQQSAPITISVNPAAGANDDFVTAVNASCPDFVIDAPGLPAEVYRTCDYGCVTCAICTTLDSQSYQFTASYRPTVAGMSSCPVNIVTNNTTTKTITLTGTGTVPPVAISVDPPSINFGDVRSNTDSTEVGIKVGNNGGSTMTVYGVSIGPNFTITSGPTTQYDVGPGGSMAYTVVCHPTSTGAMAADFVVTSNDPSNGTVKVPLSCNGIDSALSIDPSPVTMAATRVGEPVASTIHLVNSGTATMTLESATVTGTDLAMTTMPPTGTTLAPGQTFDVGVEFAASSKETVAGSLVASYDGGQQRTVQIAARALSTSMAISPDGDVDFGPLCAGQTKTQMFTVLANDEGSFTINSITDPQAPFAVTPPALPSSLKGSGGNMVTFTVTAAPTMEGMQMSSFTVATDIPGATEHTTNVAVEALTAGVTPTPATLDFGSNPIDATTIGQQVHLSNCTTGSVTWTNARIDGKDATDFAIVAQPDMAQIPANGLANWLIVLQAHSKGVKEATFSVDYDGGTATVALAGEGLGPNGSGTGTDGTDRSYYTCSTGSPTTWWPIALALLAMMLMSRRDVVRDRRHL